MARLGARLAAAAVAAIAVGAAPPPLQAAEDPLCDLLGTCPPGEPGPSDPTPPIATASRLVFTRNAGGQVDLHVVDAGGTVTPLAGVNSTARDADPAVSPDGRRLLFSSNRDGDHDLYVADLADPATTVSRLTNGRGAERNPAWSPDGTKVAYTFIPAARNDPPYVRILDLDTGADSGLTDGYSEGGAWSPDGTRLAVVRGTNTGREVFVYSVTGTADPVRLTTNSFEEREKSPEWSPDGKWIVFVSYRSQFNKGRNVPSEWGLSATRPTDSDGDGVGDDLHRFHDDGGGYVDQPDWHPDGTSIAYSTGKIMRAAVSELDGRLALGTPSEVTTGPTDYQPDWWRDPIG